MDLIPLKLVASLIDGVVDFQSESVAESPGSTIDFNSLLQNLNSTQKASLKAAISDSLPNSSLNTGYDSSIESFKKALLAKGKPLNKASLKVEDLPLLKKFLVKSGFPQEKIDRILTDLLQNNPTGEINLSAFFQKITELGPAKNSKQTDNYLEQAALPQLESILRNFGMTPAELERILSVSRIEDGRLDLKKFTEKLNEIASQQKNQTRFTALQKLDSQLSDKLKMLGIHIDDQNRSGQISLKDFITSLKKTAGMPDAKQQLPADVKTSMEQVLAKVVMSDGKAETTISKAHDVESVDKEGLLSPLLNKAKPDPENVLLAPFKEPGRQVSQKNSWPSLKDKNKAATQEGLSASSKETGPIESRDKLPDFINEKGERNLTIDQSNATSDGRADKAGLLGKLNTRSLKHTTKQENQAFKLEPKVVNIHQQAAASSFTESIDTAQQGQKPAHDFLPAYLIDQVGKQISKALLKADRIIRLQLKPPELGAVKIEMDMRDNVLRLEMITESSSAKDILLSNAHELKHTLMQQGIKVENLDVQVSYDFNHSLANSEQGSKERQRSVQGQDNNTSAIDNNLDDPKSKIFNRIPSDRLLNLVA